MTNPSALRHLLSWGLVGGPRVPIELPDAAGLASLVEFHQVTGVVLAALEHGAAVDVPDAVIDDVAERHLRALHRSLAAEADMVAVARRLEVGRIPFRVLKGCATAHLDYVDPALRSTSDVDVLVPIDRLAHATEVVSELSDRSVTVPDRRRSWTERYGKDRTIALRSGGWLDLHRMLVPGYHGLTDDHDWFADADTFVVAGADLPALSLADRLVHALAHAGFSDEVRYHSIRDVPILLDAVGERWVDAVKGHPDWAGLLARGVAVVWTHFDLEPHPLQIWAEHVSPSWRERTALRTFELQGSRQHWGGVLAVGPWRWPGLLAPMTVPSREYLAHYDRSLVGHVRSTAAKIRRSGRRR